MTYQLILPADLESAVQAHATAAGWPMTDAILDMIRQSAGNGRTKRPSPVRPLLPSVYPEEGVSEDEPYNSVPFPVVGTAFIRFVDAGPLLPSVVPDDE